MARYGADIKLAPEKVIDLAAKYFTEESAGLKVTSKTSNSLCLESPEGYITISACRSETNAKKTHIELEVKEFDMAATEFLKSL